MIWVETHVQQCVYGVPMSVTPTAEICPGPEIQSYVGMIWETTH